MKKREAKEGGEKNEEERGKEGGRPEDRSAETPHCDLITRSLGYIGALRIGTPTSECKRRRKRVKRKSRDGEWRRWNTDSEGYCRQSGV